MPLLNQEVNELASSLSDKHGGGLTAVAALVHLTTCLFSVYGQAQGVDLQPLLDLQRCSLERCLEAHDMCWSDLQPALDDLHRANTTAAYLASLPA